MSTRAAFIGIGYQLWRRSRGVVLATAALTFALVLVVHLIRLPEWARLIVLAGVFAIGFTSPFFIQVFTYSGDLGSTDSSFPRHMMVLPLSARALAYPPIVYGAGFLSALWFIVARLVLEPAGFHAPLVWPALTIAAVSAWLATVSWMPFWFPYARVIVFGGIMTAIAAFVLVTRALAMPEPLTIGGLLAATALAFPAAANGVARARRGDGTVAPWTARRTAAAAPPPRSRPFRSAQRAQIWFELRRNGSMTAFFVLIMMAFAFPLLLMPQSADLVDVLIAPMPFLPTAIFLIQPVMWFGIVGGNLALPDGWKVTSQPPAFLSARPMSDGQLISAKVKASAVVVLFVWAIVLALVGLSMLVPHGNRQAETLAHFLSRHATPRRALIAGAALVGLISLSWLSALKSFAVTLYGRKWINNARVFGFILLIGALGATAQWAWTHRESQVLPIAAHVAAWALIAAKIAAAVPILFAIRRRRIANNDRLIVWTAMWLLAVAMLFGVAFRLVPAIRHSPIALAAGIALVVPYNRLIGMPLAWHLNRHR